MAVPTLGEPCKVEELSAWILKTVQANADRIVRCPIHCTGNERTSEVVLALQEGEGTPPDVEPRRP